MFMGVAFSKHSAWHPGLNAFLVLGAIHILLICGTDRRPEAVWVTVTACDADIFTGRVLNQPSQLNTVQRGQQIRFIMPGGSEHPVLVTDKYLRERPAWTIHPCQKGGLTELFDAPSDLMRVVFPNVPEGAIMEAFTSFCPLCGGVQSLEFRETGEQNAKTLPPPKAWWQIWKKV